MTGMRPTMLATLPNRHRARKASVPCPDGRAVTERRNGRVDAIIGTIKSILGYRPRVRAIRRFTVRPVLPPALSALGDLAGNLRWSWHPPTQDVFAEVDPEIWECDQARPGPAPGCGEPRAARGARRRPGLPRPARCGEGRPRRLPRRRALVRPQGRRRGADPDRLLLPGVRHHRRAAAVLRRPRHPGRRPPQGRQRPRRPAGRRRPALPRRLLQAVALARGLAARAVPRARPRRAARSRCSARRTATARHDLDRACPDGPELLAKIWVAQVGRVPLLLLDSDVEGNPDHYREVTDRLYGGTSEHRLRQEILLGIGGVRALRVHARITGASEPEVFHTNEGHAGFLGLERIRELTVEEGGPEARLRHRPRGVPRVHGLHHPHPGAGRHRPVLPRADRAVLRHGRPARPAYPLERVLALGAEDYAGGDPTVFNMAVMGFRLAQRANGVSQLHGHVEPRDVPRPLAGLRRGRGADHVDHQRRARPDLGRARGLRPRRAGTARTATPTTVDSFWQRRRPGAVRRHLGGQAACCASGSCTTPGAAAEVVHSARASRRPSCTWVDEALDPDVLTIGFARRVPSYKRLTLMLRDPERLKRLLLHPERPVQLIIAGKAHPADDGGKKLIQELVRFADDPEVRHRIVFLPNYDIAHGPAALPRLRRLAEQPAAPLRGVRHVGHEGRPQRWSQPVDPRRLVGRVVRRLQRLGDPVRRRRRRPRPPRRPRGDRALRPDREGRRAALLRRRPGRRTRRAGSRWSATP